MVFISHFGFEGCIWVLIASVPDLCILLTFGIPMGINCAPLVADLFLF